MKPEHRQLIILIVKLVIISGISVGVYFFLSYLDNKRDFENFANAIRAERDDYIKYNETTMIDRSETAPVAPLSNSDDKVWTNKTLAQCIENCNSNEKCIGFTRDKVPDEAQGTCYPYEKLTKCYTGFKGDDYQRNDALQFDTYFKKSSDPLSLMTHMNMCLGGNNNSMGKDGRSIIIKSVAEPDKYIGYNENTSTLTLISHNDSDFGGACMFKIMPGLYGTGTVSLQHGKSGKFIYRSLPDSNGVEYLTLTQIDKNKDSIDDTLRGSFHIVDSLALYDTTQKYDAVSIQCVPMRLEIKTQDHKYVTITNSRVTAQTAGNESEIQQMQSYVILDYNNYSTMAKSVGVATSITTPTNGGNTLPEKFGDVGNSNKIGVVGSGTSARSKIGMVSKNSDKKEKYNNLGIGVVEQRNDNVYDDRYVNAMFKIGADANNSDSSEFEDLISKYYTSDKYINKDLLAELEAKKQFNKNYEDMKAENKIGSLLGKNGMQYEAYKKTVNNTMNNLENMNNDINKKYSDLTAKLDRLKMEDMATDLNFMKQLAKID